MRVDGKVVEMADESRARRLMKAANAEPVRSRRGQLVGINLRDFGRSKGEPRCGNPLKYSHNHETESNPEGVWTLKRIPDDTADIFGVVVKDCVVKAA